MPVPLKICQLCEHAVIKHLASVQEFFTTYLIGFTNPVQCQHSSTSSMKPINPPKKVRNCTQKAKNKIHRSIDLFAFQVDDLFLVEPFVRRTNLRMFFAEPLILAPTFLEAKTTS